MHHPGSEERKGRGDLQKAGGKVRRGGGELPPGHAGEVGARLRGAKNNKQETGDAAGFRLRPGGA